MSADSISLSFRGFEAEGTAFVQNFCPIHLHSAWLPGHIETVQGPSSYFVQLFNNHVVCHHIKHICYRSRACQSTDHFDPANNMYDDLFSLIKPTINHQPNPHTSVVTSLFATNM